MTRILKLEMKGFKSFAQKTEIPFGDQFNVILGPNGSGKSNVLDALCFVLGKSSAKSLRAEKSANLIYNGGKKKNPSKSGEVSIYFDNSQKIFPVETKDVKITRVIKSSGNSVYKINDETRTRTQVLDLLSIARINPDGYNIILQGDIVRLVEMSLVERRQIIEEIAGISVYEDKKEKALRELNRVEERLNEAEIILTERKGFIRELKKERDQAMKFKELDDNIKRNKATILTRQIKTKSDTRDSLEKEIEKNNKEIEVIQKKVEELRDKVAEKKDEIEQLNKEVEEKGEKEQVELHKEIEQMRVNLALNKQRIETVKQEIHKIKERKEELDRNKKEIGGRVEIIVKNKRDAEKRIESKQKELQLIEQKIESFRKKNNLDDAGDLDKKIDELDSAAEELQAEMQKLREEQQNLFREKDKYEIQLQNIDSKIEKVLSVEKENKEALTQLKLDKEKFKTITTDLSKRISEDTSLVAQLDTARSKLLSKKEELSRLQIRNSGLREQIAGDKAVKEILDMKFPGVHGLVSQLGNVSTEHSVALGIAAGGRIKSIVTSNDEQAAKCIKHLRETRSGTASFLPMNKLRPPIIKAEYRNMKGNGIIGMAIDLVTYDSKYEKVFQYVFANTLVVEDIDVARRIGVGQVRMVTLAGDLIEVSGAMQGGYRNKQQTISFQEKEITKQLADLEFEINDLETVVDRLDKSRKENEQKISELRTQKAELESEILKIEKSLHIEGGDLDATKGEKKKITEEVKKIEEDTDNITEKIMEKNRELAKLKSEKQILRDKISEMRNPAVLAEINTFEQKKQDIKEELVELRGELKNSQTEMNTLHMPELENIEKISKQQEKELNTFLDEQRDLEKTVKQQDKDMAEKEKKQEKFYAQYKGLFNKRTKLNDEINKSENTISNRFEDIRRVEHKTNALSIDRAKIIGELEGLEEEFKDFKDVPVFKNKSDDEILREIKQFERMAEDMGAVNMKALEMYDKAEKEYNLLIEKKDKLGNEREDILLMINEIDSKKRELFLKTFDVVNENFKGIFQSLSTKGQAYLDLEDKKDPFNGGVEIKVRITGKKFMDIRGLSGGEKTMTALAFIFAIQEHEPASFYILDEVDAALDKKNSEKLAELVNSYADRAQYVIISHNDGVITAAQNLYGVSMNEHGMSKVTSLKI